MLKLFCCSDIHAFYNEWQTALSKAGYDRDNPSHILVVCGDLLDRGDYPYQSLRFVNLLPPERKVLIKGNHEELLLDCLARKEFYNYDVSNGTAKTILDLGDYGAGIPINDAFINCAKDPMLKQYIDSLHLGAEIGPYIFVHGWLPHSNDKDWREATPQEWNRASWENGIQRWHDYKKKKKGLIFEPGKTVVVGHYHASYGHSHFHQDRPEFPPKNRINWQDSFVTFEDTGIIALDGCTAYSGIVNVKVLEVTEEEFKNARFY